MPGSGNPHRNPFYCACLLHSQSNIPHSHYSWLTVIIHGSQSLFMADCCLYLVFAGDDVIPQGVASAIATLICGLLLDRTRCPICQLLSLLTYKTLSQTMWVGEEVKVHCRLGFCLVKGGYSCSYIGGMISLRQVFFTNYSKQSICQFEI